ncbi:exodeoxyribonuclease VII small subunit [Mucisphaera calidilacus]|uniref:Exodeoxyribonuclease 7 small subunit n=1 Tax=Mucisphaera calidilacus TaxID=2527982 RepID=A0A518BWE4_9BACT|nr:exodeoxyribonuclease VII small subunit [Mucisphaera calidilacus]QDU71302.1 Exodeoxyribonuclease 7 small subunit [Mucisphaera calidilacus]
MADPKPKAAAKLSFEEAIDELEGVIEAIEAGEIGLEEVLKRYERGVGLIHRCRDVLERAESKLKKLRVDEDGVSMDDDPGDDEA